MSAPSRGTALYAATLVTIGAAAGVRFFTTAATAVPTPPAAPPVAAPVAATSASSPSPTDADSTLTWGRGPHPSATTSATPIPTASAPTVPSPRPAPTTAPTTAPAAPAPAAAKPTAPAPAAPAAPATSVVVGSTVQTRYGPVQVSVTFTGGALTAVRALQSPSGGYSSQVSAFALPVLSAEAVAAGSASIATVSGASYTSAAYRQSLQYAIDHHG